RAHGGSAALPACVWRGTTSSPPLRLPSERLRRKRRDEDGSLRSSVIPLKTRILFSFWRGYQGRSPWLVGLTVSVRQFCRSTRCAPRLRSFSSTAVRCSLVMGNSNSALRLRTSLFPHESTPSQFGFVDALYHRKVLDGYSSLTNAVGSDADDARKAGAPLPPCFLR